MQACLRPPGISTGHVPGGFVPAQDKEYIVSLAQLPEGATLDRTEATMSQMNTVALEHPAVMGTSSYSGLSINGVTKSSSTALTFRPAETLQGSPGGQRRSGGGRPDPRVQQHRPRLHGDFSRAAGVWPRNARRLQAADRGPRGPGIRRAVRGDPGVHQESLRGAGAQLRSSPPTR